MTITSGLASVGCAPKDTAAPTVSAAAASPAAATNIRFIDVAEQAGLNYTWTVTGKRPINILQGIGNGCAFLDYDGDGNLDILLVGPKLALYKGDGKGGFTEVTHDMGLDGLHGDFLGCAVGDYDNDGFEDIYLSAYRGGALLHNEHGKRFTDVSKAAGIATQPWGTGAAFVDIDNDGKLDLYIGDYLDFSEKTQPQLCEVGGVMTTCAPTVYNPIKGVLYRNSGGTRFVDATALWKAGDISGKTLGVATADFDGSGRQGVMLANDAMPGDLLKFDGKQFSDIGVPSGTAVDANGNAQNGMGIDWGDYDNDGRLDLAVGTFEHQTKSIYHNDGRGLFTEKSTSLGASLTTFPFIAFGVKWLDADNDGWLDLMIVNGHVRDNVADIDKTAAYRQPTLLLQNMQGKAFTDVSASALSGTAGRGIVGRGLAVGDYDNDGRVDALVVDSEGKPLLLHNETQPRRHWLEVRLVGTHSNRDGQGAQVTVEANGKKLVRQCSTNGSYLSASGRCVHFGLDEASAVEPVIVRWPSGHSDTYRGVRADGIVTLREGGTASPAP